MRIRGCSTLSLIFKKIVEISKNWFTTDIAVSYVFDDYGRFVTYAHDLDKNNTSKMSVYYVLI